MLGLVAAALGCPMGRNLIALPVLVGAVSHSCPGLIVVVKRLQAEALCQCYFLGLIA